MGQSWNLTGRTALATLAGLAVLEGLAGPGWAGPSASRAASPPAAVASESPRRVSVDFVEAELGDIVKALSVQSGVNVAVTAGVKGKVTVRLKGTTLDDALRLISRLANVDYKQINGTYVVGTPEELRSLAIRSGVAQTLAPRYLALENAREVAQTAAPYVLVEAKPQSGQLVLRGLAEDVAAARAALAAADVRSAAPPMVITPAKLKPKALAELLSKTLPELKCSVKAQSVVIEGTLEDLVQAQEVARGADATGVGPTVTRIYKLKYLGPTTAAAMFADTGKGVTAQVADSSSTTATSAALSSPSLHSRFPHLAVTPGPETISPTAGSFRPLSLDSAKSFNSSQGSSADASSAAAGGSANSKAKTLIIVGPEDEVTEATALLEQVDVAPVQVMIEARVVETSPETFKNVGLQWDFGTTGLAELAHGVRNPGVNVGVLTRPPINFQATINALVQNQSAKVLADPKIAVIDGEDASIFIGDTVRYRVLSSVSSGGQQVFDVKEVPVGIVLLCRPRVGADGLVTLKVNPVVSTITAFVGPEQLPQTASREANSTIRVKDGDTIVIGGLIQEQDRQTFSKVPILGDLPIVGQLFRNNNHDKKRTEVTIFLTTHILQG